MIPMFTISISIENLQFYGILAFLFIGLPVIYVALHFINAIISAYRSYKHDATFWKQEYTNERSRYRKELAEAKEKTDCYEKRIRALEQMAMDTANMKLDALIIDHQHSLIASQSQRISNLESDCAWLEHANSQLQDDLHAQQCELNCAYSNIELLKGILRK